MPKIIVKIEYDWPTDPYWLNPDNVKAALSTCCPNTAFEVRWAVGGNPWGWDRYHEVDEFYRDDQEQVG